jgi:hypothetical protein
MNSTKTVVKISSEVAEIIYSQLGGKMFMVMTGSNNMLYSENSLELRIAKNNSKANRLRITLECNDTYTMKFYRYSAARFDDNLELVEAKEETIEEYKDVYSDMLQDIFTEVTGLCTHL